ncbi:outer membrane protein assembly factor BamD [Pseudothauera rhizosphaerae]|uniref:Tetratricopeptide repeat-containing protein n=1 Tax=Pseudothauera rhizosphaerae TaxID=2565932 RepID=A0A4S4ANL3_9RHOO|nr:hypothetical protein [Pseudothauera rhizosphaerae]THF61209.1 hypothetical protein E6O51_10320 [Pseudothauera rhizosphaerae]
MTDHAPAIPPYWTRLGSFFLYPLSLEPLLACCGFGVLAGLASMFFVPANLVLWAVLLVATLRYGYKVLERTALGHLDDSQTLFDSAHGGKYLPYKQFVVIAVGLTICAYVASVAGPHAALVLLALFGLLLPANTMLLALTNELGESMSPPRLWALIRGIGMPYLGLCACLLLLSSGHGALFGLLASVVPAGLLGVLFGFLGGYFTIVMFRLMGYALYQYHGELGLAVDVGFERQATAIAPPDPVRQRAAQSAELLKEGRYDEAIAVARGDVVERPGDLSANLRLHRLLLAVPGQTQAMLAHARDWLPALTRVGQESYAIEVLEAIWQHQPDYQPAQAGAILPLATALLAARRGDGAARLIREFDRRFPGHADTPAIYLLGARLLIEHKRDEAQARRVLAALRQRYPESPAAAEAARLDELLDRLAAAAGGNPA